MKERFEGADGRRLRIDALVGQKLVRGKEDIAAELADRCTIEEHPAGFELIRQDDDGNDIYFILAGTFQVVVNGRSVATRGPGDTVGEMAAIQPTQRRSASVIARTSTVVAKLTEPEFDEVATRFPHLYRTIAQELSRRLLERNKLVNVHRDKIRVFIISSVEGLPIARAIQDAFERDPFTCTVWTDGVFRIANYTMESLEAAIDDSDFAIAVAHADDMTAYRGQDWPTPRDNVVLELGLFMGRLGRARSILMEPRDEKLKLPSDMTGIMTVPYRFEAGKDMTALLAPACNKLREHIKSMGPNNG
ncbi:cyclic nucleotide-binding domain-containing protein [Rhizobium leguminosarum]|uniref:TIR domain-containing protein n=1 Tax=Rhizobium leguminosarum TaxID=384 RepID=UPI001C941A65|nr:TIR domain-containing protein [Rhizobium leguminosarum]MBY5357832.1 cyclic nucleotide-binding domain-containing protein [Rhizobium leguminosarum]